MICFEQFFVENLRDWFKGHRDPKTGKHYKDIKGKKVVGNFTYLTLKKPGGSITNDADIKKQLYTWIKSNVPPDALSTKELDDL